MPRFKDRTLPTLSRISDAEAHITIKAPYDKDVLVQDGTDPETGEPIMVPGTERVPMEFGFKARLYARDASGSHGEWSNYYGLADMTAAEKQALRAALIAPMKRWAQAETITLDES